MAESTQPKFTFSNDENTQREELKTNPLMEEFRTYRAEHKDDPFFPAYHFWSPDGGLNDPNGFCFWNGKYHLFYQQYPHRNPTQHWGHIVSDDMVHWEDLPTAIYPDIERACFSGNCLVEDDRTIAMYHGLGIGNMVAAASDPLLLNWEKNAKNPVIPHLSPVDDGKMIYKVYDPFIWKEEDGYYSLSGSMNYNGVMAEHLFFSQNLEKWTYLGQLMDFNPFVECENDGACPYFLPFGEDENQYILFFFSHRSGSRALIGDYNKVTHKFTPKKSMIFSYDCVARSSLVAPCAISDGNGGVYVIYNMGESHKDIYRWGIFSLVRHMTTDSEGNVWIKPVAQNETLRQKTVLDESISLASNEKVTLNARGKCLEIVAEIDMKESRSVEFRVLSDKDGKEYTTISVISGKNLGSPKGYISIDTSHSTLSTEVYGRIPDSTRFAWNGEDKITLRIFIDKCMVEVFANDRAALCQLAYATLPESDGITVEALGGDAVIENIKVFELGSIY